MKKNILLILFALVMLGVLGGCGTPPAPPSTVTSASSTPLPPATETSLAPPTITATPDPCGPGQIEAEVQKVHRHMREFDDASTLASSTPREQLNDSIANLQRIRRESEDEPVPSCLTNLQKLQVDHMNTVISTLIAFVGGADKPALEPGIAQAQQLHDQYTLEFARLLGLTVEPAAPPAVPSETPTP